MQNYSNFICNIFGIFLTRFSNQNFQKLVKIVIMFNTEKFIDQSQSFISLKKRIFNFYSIFVQTIEFIISYNCTE